MIPAMMSTQENTKLTTKAAATRNMTVVKTATRRTHTTAGEGAVHEAAAVLHLRTFWSLEGALTLAKQLPHSTLLVTPTIYSLVG
jgi:hypothetical protein